MCTRGHSRASASYSPSAPSTQASWVDGGMSAERRSCPARCGARTAAPSRAITDPAIQGYFTHNGHRTVLSQRALQAYADPWLGYTTLDGVGQLVAEVSPYTGDLEWDNLNKLDEILHLLGYDHGDEMERRMSAGGDLL